MDYIDFKVKYSRLFQTQRDFLSYLFCTLGNGIDIDLKGHIQSFSKAEFILTDPVQPLTDIYPCSSIRGENYHMRLAGCSNKGFKEAVQYIIDCILITPDTVDYINEWKDNIYFLEELRDHPPIKNEYIDIETGREVFKKALSESTKTTSNPTVNNHDSVTKVYYFDVQWSDCPDFVEKEVQQLWKDCEYGNDNYVYKAILNESLFNRYPRIYLWLEHKGVVEGSRVLINWWW